MKGFLPCTKDPKTDRRWILPMKEDKKKQAFNGNNPMDQCIYLRLDFNDIMRESHGEDKK